MFAKFKQWVVGLKDGPVDWEELEAQLIQADLGVALTTEILAELKGQTVSALTIRKAAEARLRQLWPEQVRVPGAVRGRAVVWCLVGVNGAGKTTTLAKLAHRLGREGRRVHVVGADTFRAAAGEQLAVWADRLGLSRSIGVAGSDPAAAAYQGVAEGVAKGAEVILIDTAGRLHNKEGLMRELAKVRRVIGKQQEGSPEEMLLVIDGTNGANALAQAREFHAALGVTGVIATKLDSSAKGGVVAALKRELGLETVFVGRGETLESLEVFDPGSYVRGMLG
ncbi:MAG: signal recognition particle-docking protein FtsY [Verrucomicrobiia bacterium]